MSTCLIFLPLLLHLWCFYSFLEIRIKCSHWKCSLWLDAQLLLCWVTSSSAYKKPTKLNLCFWGTQICSAACDLNWLYLLPANQETRILFLTNWTIVDLQCCVSFRDTAKWFNYKYMKVKVTQSCLTLCDPMDYTVHGILQTRILEWVTFPFSRVPPNPGIEPGLPHCRQILYQLSHQGSPYTCVCV